MHFIRSLQILLVVVAVCILAAGSFAIGLHYGRQQSVAVQNTQAPAEKTETAKAIEQMIEESGVVSGAIVSIDNDSITIDAQTIILNPLEAPQTKRETIRLTSDTKIIKRVTQSMEEIQKSQEEFIKALTSGDSPSGITPPSTYTETSGTVGDLTVGKFVSITLDKEAQTRTAFSIAVNE